MRRLTMPAVLALLLLAAVHAQDKDANLVANPGFEQGWKGWRAPWGQAGAEIADDGKAAHSGKLFLVLTADGANVAADSNPILPGSDFNPNEAQLLSAYVSVQGIERGGFGLRLYCYDAEEKCLAMKSVGDVAPGAPPSSWQKIEAKVGPGTDFSFPKETDHVAIRFSFWTKEGNCKGKALVDDVFFGPARSESPAATRPVKRTDKGAIAIWRDKVPAVGAASDPDYLALLLESSGFGVNRIDTRDLADRAVLNSRNFDLLILPYGECYPACGAGALKGFLRGGGALITLGGRCFREPIYASAGGWVLRGAVRSDARPPVPMVPLSPDLIGPMTASLNKEGEAAAVSLGKDSSGNAAIAMDVPDLKTFKYLSFDIQGRPDYTLVHFRARGDEATKCLCIEMNEADGARWKAVVDLSPEWRTYELSTGEFLAYAVTDRARKGGLLRAERAKKILFGFPQILVGPGQHSFQVSEMEWRAGDARPEEICSGAILLKASSPLEKAFGAQLDYPSGAGDVTAFYESKPFEGELHAAPGPNVFPTNRTISGDVRGWTATILEDNRPLLRARKGHSPPFLPTEKLARSYPLLITSAGEPAASLFFHLGGRYVDGLWACFGVASADLFRPDDPEMGKAFVSLVERMLGGAVFGDIEPRFTVRDGRARMEVCVEVVNRSPQSRTIELHAHLRPLNGKAVLADRDSLIEMDPWESREVLAIEADAGNFNWKAFRVECRLISDGQALDRIATSLDVQGTFLRVCDRFIERQRERGDGRIHGYGYIDNRAARGLLAAYDLTGKREYRDGAVAWGRATIAEQRADGGYLMGYGYHPDGNECFVADGGEIACGIARLTQYTSGNDKKRFMDSLRAYMAYRDSWRCEGGGIGVGWCKSDYGASPIKPLDKITRIYAPEKNIYTIGCTLAAATMYARLTGDPKDHDAAVRDAYWWMERCKSTSGGAFVESTIWANKFLRGEKIRKDTEQFLRAKFVPHVVEPGNRWWTTGEGRTVQGIDGLAYYCDCIEKDPIVLAALMRAAYHICSPEALSGIPRILEQKELSPSEWQYLCFASVSLPDLVKSEIVRNGF